MYKLQNIFNKKIFSVKIFKKLNIPKSMAKHISLELFTFEE